MGPVTRSAVTAHCMVTELTYVLFGPQEAVSYGSLAEETGLFLAPGMRRRGWLGSVGNAGTGTGDVSAALYQSSNHVEIWLTRSGFSRRSELGFGVLGLRRVFSEVNMHLVTERPDPL